ncbi:hypothetical protein [Devosia sp. UYZn731]|uniref:hypothetical protein n=1 Tax=Devosia sp. UYZn731 TaxID=3156345 RepID=UPI003395CB1A
MAQTFLAHADFFGAGLDWEADATVEAILSGHSDVARLMIDKFEGSVCAVSNSTDDAFSRAYSTSMASITDALAAAVEVNGPQLFADVAAAQERFKCTPEFVPFTSVRQNLSALAAFAICDGKTAMIDPVVALAHSIDTRAIICASKDGDLPLVRRIVMEKATQISQQDFSQLDDATQALVCDGIKANNKLFYQDTIVCP